MSPRYSYAAGVVTVFVNTILNEMTKFTTAKRDDLKLAKILLKYQKI